MFVGHFLEFKSYVLKTFGSFDSIMFLRLLKPYEFPYAWDCTGIASSGGRRFGVFSFASKRPWHMGRPSFIGMVARHLELAVQSNCIRFLDLQRHWEAFQTLRLGVPLWPYNYHLYCASEDGLRHWKWNRIASESVDVHDFIIQFRLRVREISLGERLPSS